MAKKKKKKPEVVESPPDTFELREHEYIHFGYVIAAVRKAVGLSQAHFGAMLEGYSQTNIARYESGDVDPPLEFWRKFTRIFSVSVSWALAGVGEPYVRGSVQNPWRLAASRFFRALLPVLGYREQSALRYRRAVQDYFGLQDFFLPAEGKPPNDSELSDLAGPPPPVRQARGVAGEVDQAIEDVSRVSKKSGSKRSKRRKGGA